MVVAFVEVDAVSVDDGRAGACLSAGVLEEWVFEEPLLEEPPAELVADAVLRSGVLAGAGCAADAEAVVPVSALSEDLAFLDLLFFVVLESTPAAVFGMADLASALSEVSPLLLFFERLFLVVLVSALAARSLVAVLPAPALSAASADFLERLFFFAVVGSAVPAAELSAASAVSFFDRLFLAGAAESSEAAVSALFFLDFDFGVFAESALASVLLCEASAAAFFLLFFFAVLLLSLWSVEPDCCAPRAVTLPQISNIAANSAKTTALFDLIVPPPSASVCLAAGQSPTQHVRACWGCSRHAVQEFLSGMRASSWRNRVKSR